MELLDLLVVPAAVLVSIAKIKYALQGRDRSRLHNCFLRVEQRCDRVRHGPLAQKERLADISVLLGAGPYTAVDFFKLAHDGQHLVGYGLSAIGRSRSEIRFGCTEHDRHVQTQCPKVRHPEQADALIAVMIRVDQ